MARILLSGIPGTGKTTVAEHLALAHNYAHVDMEADEFEPRRRFRKDPASFLRALGDAKDIVMSWGFGPYDDNPLIGLVRQAGYTLIWLDGDRVASLASFLRREQHDERMEAAYYGQVNRIIITELVQRLDPVLVNPFRDGSFRPTAEIADEILHKA